MDLLTPWRGFYYIGSTITSLIYASFTFIFCAEAAVMAYALELAFDMPPVGAIRRASVAVVPLVTHGVSVIGKLQVDTAAVAGHAGGAPCGGVGHAPGASTPGFCTMAAESGLGMASICFILVRR